MPPILPPLPATRLTAEDVQTVKKIPKILLTLMEKFPGEKGDKGDTGRQGRDGLSIIGPMGLEGPIGPIGKQGPAGKNGSDGKDGVDGLDGVDGMPGKPGKDGTTPKLQELQRIAEAEAEKEVKYHEEEFNHYLLHDSHLVGTKTIDESDIGDKKFIMWDAVKQKLVYKLVPKGMQGIKYLSTGGTGLPDQDGHAGEFLTTDGDTLSWAAVSSGGITRVIQSVAIATAAAAVANTDYVYLVSGTTTITMPTAVGNTNRYTIKNVGVNTVTIVFTGAETGDGSLTLSLPVANTSLDLISNNTNWNII